MSHIGKTLVSLALSDSTSSSLVYVHLSTRQIEGLNDLPWCSGKTVCHSP